MCYVLKSNSIEEAVLISFVKNALISGTCTYLICKIYKPGLTLIFREKDWKVGKKNYSKQFEFFF